MSEENIATQWDPVGYDQNARFVSDLGEPVLQLMNPKAGEMVLDLGCGDGELTLKLMDAGCHVIAVDSSPAMVESSLAKGINARVMDGQHLEFEGAFDAVFSNAALHWMTQPREVIAGVKRVLKPAGRFVAEMGGQGNVVSVLAALKKNSSAQRLGPCESLVLSQCGGISSTPGRSRLSGASDSVDSPSNSFAREASRLVGDLCRFVPEYGGSRA